MKRTVLKYSLMQLPGLAACVLILALLRYVMLIPTWSIYIVLSLWIIKDIILFPFVWKAYNGSVPEMIGGNAIAAERLDPSGHVRIKGELWQAETAKGRPAVEKGQTVTVIDKKGLTLIVERAVEKSI